MTDLLTALRLLANETAGFSTNHPSLVAWLPIDVGNAAKALITEGVLVKSRDGYTGRVMFRGAHLPAQRRKNASGKPRDDREPLVDIMRRLARDPHGFSAKHPAFEAAGWTSGSVIKSAVHLVRRGELHKVKASAHLNVYFATLEGAQRGADALTKSNTRAHGNVSVAPRQALSGPVDASRAKLVVCPGFVPRNVALDVLCPLLRQAPYRRVA